MKPATDAEIRSLRASIAAARQLEEKDDGRPVPIVVTHDILTRLLDELEARRRGFR